ncbi:DUF397 domain-containing protein [Streptomyces finlayi]|uniref:DUF397 domain-containing protein n=1 Tax=Streptomyces finlayi TaxID=67296 RepID=A0A7G7BP40_9ACTN|nr:DUF397 domain-containing protein [Streptomyces finlayi]QNE77105.1 DUF397 domain-containing protein [Streptomyces finlayi]
MDSERVWFKSSYSGGSGTECVEVANLHAVVGVRDSKRPEGASISVRVAAWAEFVSALRL